MKHLFCVECGNSHVENQDSGLCASCNRIARKTPIFQNKKQTMEQIIIIQDLKNILPNQATVQFQRKKGQTGKWFLEINVRIVPSISEKEHQQLVDKIIAFYGEDLIEVYTEEQGHWFYVYLRMSSTVPTTVQM
jgi:hypothetical protein